ncbi:MAG: hypothetical protein HC876_12310 [Chloroflexaceae bacterium]|nr:hypothetical protein [Chloroflexaceae bacterium]
MNEQYLNQRQQQAAEYFQEDGGLTDDLTDAQAAPLIEWASHAAAQAAGNPEQSDEAVDQLLKALRRAIKRGTRAATADTPPEDLLTRVQQALHDGLAGKPERVTPREKQKFLPLRMAPQDSEEQGDTHGEAQA